MSDPHPLSYTLIDPRPIAAKAPYTFFRPSETEVAAIRSGDFVKLMFEHVPLGQDWEAERMWVLVEMKEDERFIGKLANDPFETTAKRRAGDGVAFAPHHVISIRWANPDSAPRPVQYREYWERCLVDDCVLDGTEAVEFIYREEPDMQDEEDKYPDSGWRIRGRVGNSSEGEVDARTFQYVAIGAVLNRDDSWLHLIDSPIGSRFMRNFRSRVYEVDAN